MTITGAIFDCDGTIVDSMSMWWSVFPELLAAHGRAYDKQVAAALKRCEAMSLPDEIRSLKEELSIAASEEELFCDLTHRIRKAYSTTIQPWPRSKAFLQQLADANIPMIIATSTSAAEVRLCLERLDMMQYFIDIISAEEKDFNKQEPDIYLYALEELETNRASTWVFEDAPFGLMTAAASGFPTVCVHNDHDARNLDAMLPYSTLLTHIFEDLSLATIQNLPDPTAAPAEKPIE